MNCWKCDAPATHYVCVVVGSDNDTTYVDQYTCDYHTKLDIPDGYGILEVSLNELDPFNSKVMYLVETSD